MQRKVKCGCLDIVVSTSPARGPALASNGHVSVAIVAGPPVEVVCLCVPTRVENWVYPRNVTPSTLFSGPVEPCD